MGIRKRTVAMNQDALNAQVNIGLKIVKGNLMIR